MATILQAGTSQWHNGQRISGPHTALPLDWTTTVSLNFLQHFASTAGHGLNWSASGLIVRSHTTQHVPEMVKLSVSRIESFFLFAIESLEAMIKIGISTNPV